MDKEQKEKLPGVAKGWYRKDYRIFKAENSQESFESIDPRTKDHRDERVEAIDYIIEKYPMQAPYFIYFCCLDYDENEEIHKDLTSKFDSGLLSCYGNGKNSMRVRAKEATVLKALIGETEPNSDQFYEHLKKDIYPYAVQHIWEILKKYFKTHKKEIRSEELDEFSKAFAIAEKEWDPNAGKKPKVKTPPKPKEKRNATLKKLCEYAFEDDASKNVILDEALKEFRRYDKGKQAEITFFMEPLAACFGIDGSRLKEENARLQEECARLTREKATLEKQIQEYKQSAYRQEQQFLIIEKKLQEAEQKSKVAENARHELEESVVEIREREVRERLIQLISAVKEPLYAWQNKLSGSKDRSEYIRMQHILSALEEVGLEPIVKLSDLINMAPFPYDETLHRSDFSLQDTDMVYAVSLGFRLTEDNRFGVAGGILDKAEVLRFNPDTTPTGEEK